MFQERQSKSAHLQSKDGHRFKSVTQVEKFPLSQATSETQDTSGIPRSLPVRPAKIGSLQIFAENLGPIENFSSDIFDVDEVHKIAILDLRLLNLDRNLCNILVCCEKGHEGNFEKYKLVPIDHGLSIPDTLSINSYELAWLSFDQASLPFSQRSLDYIRKLDIKADIELLQ